MPNHLIGDRVSEAERQKYIHSKTHKKDSTTVKFGPLDPKSASYSVLALFTRTDALLLEHGPNQLVLPDHLADHFSVHCVDAGPHPPAGVPTIHYDHESSWNIHH